MDIIKLVIIFILIMGIIKFEKPLFIVIIAGTIMTSILYGLGPKIMLAIVIGSIINPITIGILLPFYTIAFIQRMIDERGYIELS